MYSILSYLMQDEKADYFVNGVLYNAKKDIVGKIFDIGKALDVEDVSAPFIAIVNEKDSNVKKNKVRKDKIYFSVDKAGTLFLASKKVKDLFEKEGVQNVQFFDVVIKTSLENIDTYSILNITDKIDCVNINASDLMLFPNGFVRRTKKLVLEESKIPKEKKIFLLEKYPSQMIIVHDDLKNAINEEGLTGFTFVNLDAAGQIS